MVINHLLNGMILQIVKVLSSLKQFAPENGCLEDEIAEIRTLRLFFGPRYWRHSQYFFHMYSKMKRAVQGDIFGAPNFEIPSFSPDSSIRGDPKILPRFDWPKITPFVTSNFFWQIQKKNPPQKIGGESESPWNESNSHLNIGGGSPFPMLKPSPWTSADSGR